MGVIGTEAQIFGRQIVEILPFLEFRDDGAVGAAVIGDADIARSILSLLRRNGRGGEDDGHDQQKKELENLHGMVFDLVGLDETALFVYSTNGGCKRSRTERLSFLTSFTCILVGCSTHMNEWRQKIFHAKEK